MSTTQAKTSASPLNLWWKWKEGKPPGSVSSIKDLESYHEQVISGPASDEITRILGEYIRQNSELITVREVLECSSMAHPNMVVSAPLKAEWVAELASLKKSVYALYDELLKLICCADANAGLVINIEV